MAGPPVLLGFGILVFAAVCVQLGWRYISSRSKDSSDDEDVFKEDVERQLQHELNDAVEEASSKATTPLISSSSIDHTAPLLGDSPSWHFVRVSYHELSPSGCRAEYRREYRSHQQSYSLVNDGARMQTLDSMDETGDDTPGYAVPPSPEMVDESSKDEEPAVMVNAKQYFRILKRRAAREWIEKYFEERKKSDRVLRERISSTGS